MGKYKFEDGSQFCWPPQLVGETKDQFRRRILDDYETAINIIKEELGEPDEPQERHYKTHQRASRALDVQEGGDHYKTKGIQPVEYIFANNIGFCEGNIIKYVTRWKDKGGVEDLKKARHYLDLLIENEVAKVK